MNKKTAKHLVYAEDVLRELMHYPDRCVDKGSIRHIIEKVVSEKEVVLEQENKTC